MRRSRRHARSVFEDSGEKGSRTIKPAIVKLQHALSGLKTIPKEPLHVLRDIWPGDADRAAALLTGRICVDGRHYAFHLDKAALKTVPTPVREEITKFIWLRDLATLGTEEARLFARTSIARWIDQPFDLMDDAVCAATRLCAITGHYEFFARTAEEAFRRRLMRYLLLLGRMLPLAEPIPNGHWSALSVIRGIMVAGFYLPGLSFLRERAIRRLEDVVHQLIHPDGCVRQRSPNAQFQVVRELTEMSAILRMAQQPVSDVLMVSLGRLCPVLRAMRHGDGGVALFNGGWAHDGDFVERVIQYAGRQKIVAPSMPDGRFTRFTAGRMLLLVDYGPPPTSGFAVDAHDAPLSFEFSVGPERIFVNCGSSRLPVWDAVLRQPAAHNGLVTDAFSPAQSSGTPLAKQPLPQISHDVFLTEDRSKVEMTFRLPEPGQSDRLTWRRSLGLARDGRIFYGKDSVEGPGDVNFVLRFHVAPGIRIEKARDGHDCVLRTPSASYGFSQAGAHLSVEESVYFGNGFRQATSQLVLSRIAPDKQDRVATKARQSDLFDTVVGLKDDDPAKARMDVSWSLMVI